MHNYTDEMRVMADLQTFTADDLCGALDCPLGTAQSILAIIAKKRLVERVRVSHSFLYTLSEKGRAIVARLPEIDPNERVLPQVRVLITERFVYHNGTPVMDTSEDELPVISEICRGCGVEYVNLGVTGRCDDCLKKWHS